MSFSWATPEASYWGLEWAIRLLALAIVPQRRRPAAAAGWLLLILFLPVPGMLAFALFGNRRYPASRIRAFGRLDPYLTGLAQLLAVHAPARSDEAARLALELGRLPAVGGNAVELMDDYDGVVARLIADIGAARRDVFVLVYIFADDRVGQAVAAALAGAVARGVRCRVLLDPVGSHRWRRAITLRLREAGVEVRHSLPFHLLRGRTRRDMRNHRKLFVIDGAVGYAGSQNLVAKDFRPGVVNRELVARVVGPVVAEMGAVAEADWALETGELPVDRGPIVEGGAEVAQLLPSGATYPLEGLETLLVWGIHRARRRVVLVTPYLVPDDALLGALRTAVARGVRVDVVVSAVIDQRLVNLAQCSYYDGLLTDGVRLHLFRGELLHAKNVSIDGELGIVGSSNVDLRSFELNEEVSLLLHGGPSVGRLEGFQQACIEGSDGLELATWRRRGRGRVFAENIARLVSPLL